MRHTLALSLVCIFALLPASPAPAAPPEVSLGRANVDGYYAYDWNLTTDFFSNMYRAGNMTKRLESKLYLKYDCRTMTMYVLVLNEPGHIGYIVSPVDTANCWIAIDVHTNKVVNEFSGDDGVPPDFAYVGLAFDGNPRHFLGYEASFHIPGDGTTHTIMAHVEVWDMMAQTSATPGMPFSGPPFIVPNCSVGVESASWGAIKSLYR